MIDIPKRWEQWLKTLVGGAVSGGANAGLAALGTSAATAIGFTVKPFEPRQLGEMFIAGAVVGALTFLAKSPVPPDASGNTQVFVNPNPPVK